MEKIFDGCAGTALVVFGRLRWIPCKWFCDISGSVSLLIGPLRQAAGDFFRCDSVSGFSDQAADVDGPKAAGTRHFHGAPHAAWLQDGNHVHEGLDFASGTYSFLTPVRCRTRPAWKSSSAAATRCLS